MSVLDEVFGDIFGLIDPVVAPTKVMTQSLNISYAHTGGFHQKRHYPRIVERNMVRTLPNTLVLQPRSPPKTHSREPLPT